MSGGDGRVAAVKWGGGRPMGAAVTAEPGEALGFPVPGFHHQQMKINRNPLLSMMQGLHERVCKVLRLCKTHIVTEKLVLVVLALLSLC